MEARFFAPFRGFSHCSELCARRQSLPLRQLLPGCLCKAAAGAGGKFNKKRRETSGPSFAMGLPDHHRVFLRVRASATSRLAPPGQLHAARADNNTPKRDEASPFALLVGAAVPAAQKAGQRAGRAKATTSRTTARRSGHASADRPTQHRKTSGRSCRRPTASRPLRRPAITREPASAADQAAGRSHGRRIRKPSNPRRLPVTGEQPPFRTGGESRQTRQCRPVAAERPSSGSNRPRPAKPAKTDKSDKKDVSDQPAQPDAATVVATDLLPPDLQVAAVTPPPAPRQSRRRHRRCRSDRDPPRPPAGDAPADPARAATDRSDRARPHQDANQAPRPQPSRVAATGPAAPPRLARN